MFDISKLLHLFVLTTQSKSRRTVRLREVYHKLKKLHKNLKNCHKLYLRGVLSIEKGKSFQYYSEGECIYVLVLFNNFRRFDVFVEQRLTEI